MASFLCHMQGTFTPCSFSSSSWLLLGASLKKKAFFLPLKKKKDSCHSPPSSVTFHSIRALAPPPPSPQSLFGLGWGPQLPEVVQAGDPVLHEVAAPVPLEDIPSPAIQNVIDDMISVMRRAPGVGLAAPQIGVPWQIIVLEDTEQYIRLASKKETDAQQRYPFDLLVIVNPRLEKKGHQVTRFFEGCLSVDGFRGLVERHLEVEVTGFARDGSPLRIEATGWKARILQHECDHLQGLLYVDSLIPRTFRSVANLRLPLPKGCPKPGAYAKHEC